MSLENNLTLGGTLGFYLVTFCLIYLFVHVTPIVLKILLFRALRWVYFYILKLVILWLPEGNINYRHFVILSKAVECCFISFTVLLRSRKHLS